MEFNPQAPKSPETSLDDKEAKKTKRKKRAGFVVPIPVEATDRPAAEKPKPSVLDEALANLATQKQETAEEKASEKKTEAGESEEAESTEAPSEQAEESEKNKDYQHIEDQEVRPNEFSGGEVIIHLQGDEPVAERVIPLRSSNADPTPEVNPEEPLVYSRQAEQQQMRRGEAPEEADVLDAPQVNEDEVIRPEQPEVPPHLPERQLDHLQQSPPVEVVQPRPEDVYQQVEVSTSEATAPPVNGGERPATKQEVEDAIYYATKSGQNRGVLTGLLVGGGYEHFKHKRREKRQERRFKKQNKELDQTRKDEHFYFAEQSKQQVDSEQRFTAAGKRFENHSHPEKLVQSNPEQHMLGSPEQLAVPADHRLETSAWHSIEIDNKTGKPVENPTFTYGKEYYRERAKEATPKEQRNAATGEVALVAAAMSQSDAGSSATLPIAPGIPLATTQGAPKKDALKAGLKSLSRSSDDDSAKPLWPWIVALVVVVICLIIVIG